MNAMTNVEVAAEITALGALVTEMTTEGATVPYNATTDYSGIVGLITTPVDASAMTGIEVTAEIDALGVLVAEITGEYQAIVNAGNSPLGATLTAKEDLAETTDATTGLVDGGTQFVINTLVESKAGYDALVVLEDALTELETTASDAAALVDEVVLTDGANAMGTDNAAFLTGLVAGNTATISDFNLATDSIYFGDAYTVNTGALTTGDSAVIEMFITEGDTALDSLVTFETAVFGSASAGDYFEVTLTGVATDEITIANGMIIGA
jgi:hypothetical protein